MNMLQLKDKLKLVIALVIALVIMAVPCLHALQISNAGDTCPESCCCSCGYEQAEDEASRFGAPVLENLCCCSVSEPATETEVPIEGELRPTVKLVTSAAVTSETSLIAVTETELSQTIQTNQQSAHGPPLYVLHASYLI